MQVGKIVFGHPGPFAYIPTESHRWSNIRIVDCREATSKEAREWLAELISCFAIDRVSGPDPIKLVPTFDIEVLRQRARERGVK